MLHILKILLGSNQKCLPIVRLSIYFILIPIEYLSAACFFTYADNKTRNCWWNITIKISLWKLHHRHVNIETSPFSGITDPQWASSSYILPTRDLFTDSVSLLTRFLSSFVCVSMFGAASGVCDTWRRRHPSIWFHDTGSPDVYLFTHHETPAGNSRNP